MKKHLITLITALALAVAMLASVGSAAQATTTTNEQVCTGLDSGKIDVSGSHKTVTVTAPDGKLIDGYCVKAGSTKQGNGPQYETVSPPVKTITFGHDSGKDVSHYSVSYTDAPKTCQSHPTPENCPKPGDDVEKRSVQDAPNCETDTVTTRHEERTRTYVWDGNSWEPGAWSAWVTKSSTVRDATQAECPDDFTPETQTEQREQVSQDCSTDTVTTTYQKRTRTETSDGVWGEWTAWTTYKTETRRATDKECPPTEEPPVCDDVCKLPVVAGSKGNVVCNGVINGGVYRNVTVKNGRSCTLVDTYVNGNVIAKGARNLTIADTTVRGDVRASNVSGDVYLGSKDHCKYDPYVGGSVIVTGSHNVAVCDMTVCEDIVVKRNNGKITVRSSSARRIIVQENRRFVKDRGDRSHRGLSVIRLLDNDGKYVVSHNAPRKVVRR